MKQYQYRMKSRNAPNQSWSGWGNCSEQSAYNYLEEVKNEFNQWIYEVRAITAVTEIPAEGSQLTVQYLEGKALYLAQNSWAEWDSLSQGAQFLWVRLAKESKDAT